MNYLYFKKPQLINLLLNKIYNLERFKELCLLFLVLFVFNIYAI